MVKIQPDVANGIAIDIANDVLPVLISGRRYILFVLTN